MNASTARDRIGICQWFHFEDHETLERSVQWLRELGIRHVRTGLSWADYHRPGGREWADRVLSALEEFEVLLSIWHTPPSIAEGGTCAGPPRRLQDYADFVDLVLTGYGDRFSALELWNEPNNLYKWDFAGRDPDWRKFGTMIAMAAHWARCRGMRTVLGGMIPVDPSWLERMRRYGALQFIDVVAIHAFPDMWWDDAPNWDRSDHWKGWDEKVETIRPLLGDRPVWITETGLATVDLATGRPDRHALQAERVRTAASAPAERIYWYSLLDLDPRRPAIEGYHVDENEYHMGLVTWEGRRKEGWWAMQEVLSR